MEVQRAAVSISTNGANVVVTAVTGKYTKIIGLVLIAAGDVDITIKESASGTALTGAMSTGVKGNGFVLPPTNAAWFETGVSQGINIALSAGVQVSGSILYVQV